MVLCLNLLWPLSFCCWSGISSLLPSPCGNKLDFEIEQSGMWTVWSVCQWESLRLLTGEKKERKKRGDPILEEEVCASSLLSFPPPPPNTTTFLSLPPLSGTNHLVNGISPIPSSPSSVFFLLSSPWGFSWKSTRGSTQWEEWEGKTELIRRKWRTYRPFTVIKTSVTIKINLLFGQINSLSSGWPANGGHSPDLHAWYPWWQMTQKPVNQA